MPAGPENPDIDTGRVARVYAALAGSPWADAAEREAVAQDAHPGTRAARERMLSARRYHSAAALKAVTHGILGVVFGAPGRPASEPAKRGPDQVPDPHEAALAAVPSARFVYADADDEGANINDAVFGGIDHVAVCMASLRDPEGLLSCPEVKALPLPLHLQMQMSIQFWPPDLARQLLRDYGRLLPARSELLLTWTVPSGTDGGRDLMTIAADIAGTPVYRHPAEDVAGWLDDAGFRVMPPGPADVRGWVPAWAERERAQAPGRVMAVTGRLP